MVRRIEHVHLDVDYRASDWNRTLLLAGGARRRRLIVAGGDRRLTWTIRVAPFQLVAHESLPLRECLFECLFVADDHTTQRARQLELFFAERRQPLEPKRGGQVDD